MFETPCIFYPYPELTVEHAELSCYFDSFNSGIL